MNLQNKKCVPCEGGVEPLDIIKTQELSQEVPEWKIIEDNKKITRTWLLSDFVTAMKFINSVADIAETEGHHPDIHVSYNRVTIELYTHSIGGLSENDFIVAAKIDEIGINI
jgi:4a-hydroxytetrahydrobiopterin dehydratase